MPGPMPPQGGMPPQMAQALQQAQQPSPGAGAGPQGGAQMPGGPSGPPAQAQGLDPDMMKMLTAFGQLYGFNPQNMNQFAQVLQKLQMQVSQTKPGTAAYNIANNNLQTMTGMFQQMQAQSQAQQVQSQGVQPGGPPPNMAPPGLQQG